MKFTPNEQKTLDRAARILEKAATYDAVVFTSPKAVKDFLSYRLASRESEVFMVMFLDSQHKLIEAREMFQGTIDGASVYPREVAKAALETNAAAVIFAHNHPSGNAEPSRADEKITKRLCEALGLLDIRALDHFVVGLNQVVSFAERGLMP